MILRISPEEQDRSALRLAFRRINVFAVLVMACLSLSALGAWTPG